MTKLYLYITSFILLCKGIYSQELSCDSVENCLSLDLAGSHWITEENSTSLEIDQFKVKNTLEDNWERQNALWYFSTNDSHPTFPFLSYYIEIRVKNFTGGEIGVTTLDDFKPGWNLIGLLYSGGLSNGSHLLYPDFGPELNMHTNIGMYVDYATEEDVINVSFYLNQIYIGKGFSIPFLPKQLYPIVAFDGTGEVEIINLSSHLPFEDISGKADSDRQCHNFAVTSFDDQRNLKNASLVLPLETEEDAVLLVGTWELDINATLCETDDDMKLVPNISSLIKANFTDFKILLRIALTDITPKYHEYALALMGLNTVQFTIRHILQSNRWITPGTSISTNAAGNEQLMTYERWINAFLYQPQQLQLISSITPLLIFNDDCFVVFNKVYPEPISESPFI